MVPMGSPGVGESMGFLQVFTSSVGHRGRWPIADTSVYQRQGFDRNFKNVLGLIDTALMYTVV